MKLLRKYTLKELLLPFCIAMMLFTFIFLVGNLLRMADLLINKGVSIFDILKLIALLIPKMLSFTLPTSILTALLLVFGRLAQNNEIIAIRTNGVNIWSIVTPILLICLLFSLFTLVLNDQILPRVTHAYRQAIKEVMIKRPAAYLEAGRLIKDFKQYIILTQKVKGNELEGITIYQPQEGKPTRTIIAERGEIISDPNDKALLIKLYNGTSDEPNPDDPSVFYKLDFETFLLPPISLGAEDKNSQKKIKDMTIDELFVKLKEDRKDPVTNVHELRDVKTEIHKKIAFSFAPFVFALVGLPLAFITRRGEAVISFGLAIGVVAVYYVFFVWASTMAKQAIIPSYIALWLPNALLIVAGGVLMKKVVSV